MPKHSVTPIYVTRPELPPLDEFIPYLEKMWESRILTNCGPFHQQLETALCQYLGVPNISLFANATIALLAAFKALHIEGEVITTPYSFVATSHALLWNGLTPVFTDVDPVTLNLDPDKIEAAITEKTSAILPVHCYGHPCDVEKIQKIADKYKLKVIYDAAHAFGVAGDHGSVLNEGDLSVLSFHATKVFNTFEGGAIISADPAMKHLIDDLKNFGFEDEVSVIATGINGKMSEMNAALGLLQLKYVDQAIVKRGQIDARYREKLSSIKGVRCLDRNGQQRSNYSYFPVLIDAHFPLSRDALYLKLKSFNIHPRRYFYPLISEFEMYSKLASADKAGLPIAHHASEMVLCLPIYPDLSLSDVDNIVDIIADVT